MHKHINPDRWLPGIIPCPRENFSLDQLLNEPEDPDCIMCVLDCIYSKFYEAKEFPEEEIFSLSPENREKIKEMGYPISLEEWNRRRRER